MSGLRIAFAGTPDFSVPALEALLRSPHEVVGVLTQPDRPKGRGRQIAASPVKETALAHGLPISQPLTLKDEAGRADLLSWQPDMLIVVAYGLILPQAVLTLPRLGCLNIHASLLPRWRGAAPIQRSILAGDAATGVTIMVMDVGLDTGPMLLKKEVAIEPADTGGSLHDRLAALGASALLEALEGYSNGTLPATPQPTEGVTYAAKIEKAEALIDWNRDALEIERQVRAFNPWPVAETRLNGEQLRVFDAVASDASLERSATDQQVGSSNLSGHTTSASESRHEPPASGSSVAGEPSASTSSTELAQFRIDRSKSALEPGTITAIRDGEIVVQCGRGQLCLRQVQRPGRRAVSAGDFARGGGPSLIGERLG